MTEETIYTLHITGPSGDRTIELAHQVYRIGRLSDVDIELKDPQVSRKHAEIEVTDEGCLLKDLGSANGTFVSEQKLEAETAVQLTDGATIQIGPFSLLFTVATIEIPDADIEPEEQEEAEPEAPGEDEPASEEPPPPPPPPEEILDAVKPEPEKSAIPGIELRSTNLLEYLPGIYHTDFMDRFLAIFEATQIPIEWTIDNFDLFLNPGTAPEGFGPWLEGWFNSGIDGSWTVEQRRTFLSEAGSIHARLGTRWALSRVLEIYTGETPEIIDTGDEVEPHTFLVRLPDGPYSTNRDLIERVISHHKPAHTAFKLEFVRGQ